MVQPYERSKVIHHTPIKMKKLIRDLKVGDTLDPELFDLLPECSRVKVTSIHPYGTSFHSLVVTGLATYQGQTIKTHPTVCDTLLEVETE